MKKGNLKQLLYKKIKLLQRFELKQYLQWLSRIRITKFISGLYIKHVHNIHTSKYMYMENGQKKNHLDLELKLHRD